MNILVRNRVWPGALPWRGAASHVPSGQVLHRRLSADPRQQYFVSLPRRIAHGVSLLVCVHGISRNAEEHAAAFAERAARRGLVVVAPLFERERFPDYQRLGRRGRGARADLALDAIVSEVGATAGVDVERFYLTGFSGGAQFAHRYAFAFPHRVAALALAAAGWYTFPDPRTRFPRGIRRDPALPDIAFNPRAFLRIPVLALVGEHDTERDDALNVRARIDRQQGHDRQQRAKRWLAAMRAAAAEHGLTTSHRLDVLADSGHSFDECAAPHRGDLARRVVVWMVAAGARTRR